jgi:hypothetical protein
VGLLVFAFLWDSHSWLSGFPLLESILDSQEWLSHKIMHNEGVRSELAYGSERDLRHFHGRLVLVLPLDAGES